MRRIAIVLMAMAGAVIVLSGIGQLVNPKPASPVAASAPTRERVVPPTKAPEPTIDRVSQQWGEFLRYGPELANLLNRSDETNRLHAQGAALVTAGTLPDFYRLTDRAAQTHGTLKTTARTVRVPREANAYRDSVIDALSQREADMNTLKTALDRPGVAVTAAYQTARAQVDRSTVAVVGELLKLCATMQSEPAECTATVGWGSSS